MKVIVDVRVWLLQEDHSMWSESLLFHTLPQPVSQFLENQWLPLMGECAACALNLCSYLIDKCMHALALMPSRSFRTLLTALALWSVEPLWRLE